MRFWVGKILLRIFDSFFLAEVPRNWAPFWVPMSLTFSVAF